jgi:hypothetical protein
MWFENARCVANGSLRGEGPERKAGIQLGGDVTSAESRLAAERGAMQLSVSRDVGHGNWRSVLMEDQVS